MIRRGPRKPPAAALVRAARARPASRELVGHTLEAIALRLHQIAATVSLLAEGQEPPMSHALSLVEASLLDVEARLEEL